MKDKYVATYGKIKCTVEAHSKYEAKKVAAIEMGIDQVRQTRIQVFLSERDGKPVTLKDLSKISKDVRRK